MNAIARAVPNEIILSGAWASSISTAKIYFMLLVLFAMISSIGLIYTKDLNRRMFINYQEQQQVYQQLTSYHNKLLLENGAWSGQGRIQRIAEQQLSMSVPSAKTTVIVKYT